jgi:uncharacterized membrane protein
MNQFAPSTTSGRFTVAAVGVYLYGLATVAAGILDLIWGEFDAGHQPIQALGDPIPGREILAYITAVCMIAAGTAMLWRRTARTGSLVSALIYLVFGMFWLPRFYTVSHILGLRLTVFIGLLGGLFMQLIVVAGGLIVHASFAPPASSWHWKSSAVARWIFGLGSVLFGLAHLTQTETVAAMVPNWMPLGGPFWVVLSGIAFVLAGLAILSEILNVWATRLLALMVLIFEVPVLVPLVFAHPHQHMAWGANAYNLAAAGAIAIFAASISGRPAQREHDAKSQFAEV